MAKKLPYAQAGTMNRYKAIQNNEREILPEFYSKEIRDLVDYLLTVDFQKRPTI
jgi:hypothetical protein